MLPTHTSRHHVADPRIKAEAEARAQRGIRTVHSRSPAVATWLVSAMRPKTSRSCIGEPSKCTCRGSTAARISAMHHHRHRKKDIGVRIPGARQQQLQHDQYTQGRPPFGGFRKRTVTKRLAATHTRRGTAWRGASPSFARTHMRSQAWTACAHTTSLSLSLSACHCCVCVCVCV